MRKATAILLILVLLLPLLGKMGIWLHYQSNLRYYAEVLCRNQDRPELNCDGQCILAERLAATQPQEPAQPAAQLLQFELSAFTATEPLPVFPLCQASFARVPGFHSPSQRVLGLLFLIDNPPPEFLV